MTHQQCVILSRPFLSSCPKGYRRPGPTSRYNNCARTSMTPIHMPVRKHSKAELSHHHTLHSYNMYRQSEIDSHHSLSKLLHNHLYHVTCLGQQALLPQVFDPVRVVMASGPGVARGIVAQSGSTTHR
jgi:hypothetical protein